MLLICSLKKKKQASFEIADLVEFRRCKLCVVL